MGEPRILFQGAFRIISVRYNESKNASHGHELAIEKADGKDALGVPRWRAHEGDSVGLVYELVTAYDSVRAERDHYKTTAEALSHDD